VTTLSSGTRQDSGWGFSVLSSEPYPLCHTCKIFTTRYLINNLWIICTIQSGQLNYRANEWYGTNTIESGRVAPKFATWNSLRLRRGNTSWCRIENWHCLKTRRFKTPTCFFQHLRRNFLQNFESHCRVRRGNARRCKRCAHRDRKLFLHSNLLWVSKIRL